MDGRPMLLHNKSLHNHGGGKQLLVAIDLLPLDTSVVQQLKESCCKFHFIQGDFCSQNVQQELESILQGQKVDLVLSDMAANFTGNASTDAARTMTLCQAALDLSVQQLLAKNASFLTKYFSSADEYEFRQEARQYFANIKTVKPPASRKESAERYLLATGFRGHVE